MVGVLLLGEMHPFSHFPMYNSFPNWSYAFMLVKPDGKPIPVQSIYGFSMGHISHQYYSYCQKFDIAYGYDMETKAQRAKVGNAILQELKPTLAIDSTPDTLLLKRRYFYLLDDTIVKKDRIIGTLVQ